MNLHGIQILTQLYVGRPIFKWKEEQTNLKIQTDYQFRSLFRIKFYPVTMRI